MPPATSAIITNGAIHVGMAFGVCKMGRQSGWMAWKFLAARRCDRGTGTPTRVGGAAHQQSTAGCVRRVGGIVDYEPRSGALRESGPSFGEESQTVSIERPSKLSIIPRAEKLSP